MWEEIRLLVAAMVVVGIPALLEYRGALQRFVAENADRSGDPGLSYMVRRQ